MSDEDEAVDLHGDPSYTAWLVSCAAGCVCCDVCWNPPCEGCAAGGVCDMLPCRCDDEPDDYDEGETEAGET